MIMYLSVALEGNEIFILESYLQQSIPSYVPLSHQFFNSCAMTCVELLVNTYWSNEFL